MHVYQNEVVTHRNGATVTVSDTCHVFTTPEQAEKELKIWADKCRENKLNVIATRTWELEVEGEQTEIKELEDTLDNIEDDLFCMLQDDREDRIKRIFAMVRYIRKHHGQLSYIQLLQEFKDELNMEHDCWGHTMGFFFAVAGEMHERNLPVPEEWKYRSGISAIDYAVYESQTTVKASDTALRQMGDYLFKLSGYIKKIGKDY